MRSELRISATHERASGWRAKLAERLKTVEAPLTHGPVPKPRLEVKVNFNENGIYGLARVQAAAILAAHMPAPVKTSAAAPERSLDQRAGKANIHTLLLDPPEYVLTAKVFDMLLAVPKYGRVKTNRILNQCRISPSKTIGGLSERQRAELVSQLRR